MALVKEFIESKRAISKQKETKCIYICDAANKQLQLGTIADSNMDKPIDEVQPNQVLLFDENGITELKEILSKFNSQEICQKSKSWIISSNPNFYNTIGAFRKHKKVDWSWVSPNAKVGDFVYIYISGNIKQIVLKTRITTIDVPHENLFDDKEFYVNPDNANGLDETFTRLELVKEDTTGQLNLENLRSHGLKGNLQGPRILNGDLLRFVESVFNNGDPRQIIYYGAPGTGKSHGIKKQLAGVPTENIFRTTFHPDSDYSTFVGTYKPTMEEGKIVYSFVAQTFLQAYIRAYQTYENVYLIIEEINRGNCAQIFGDLFQLLDRNEEGKSDYKIKADADLRAFLEKDLGKDNEGIKGGELCLPSNLYIYATMNTSDQSLFPIDSAFKRRWEWEYVPIKYKNTDWKIVIGNYEYSWVDFQRAINGKLEGVATGEDKKLGDFFVNAKATKTITAKMLLNKVLFYLWNDVCKDGEGEIFRLQEGDNETKDTTFQALFTTEGEPDITKLQQMMAALKVEGTLVDEDAESTSDAIDDEETPAESKRDYSKYSINGEGAFSKRRGAHEILKMYVANNPDLAAHEVLAAWRELATHINGCPSNFIINDSEFDTLSDDGKKRVNLVKVRGENIYITTEWNISTFTDFMNAVNAKDWGIKIVKTE